MNSRTTSKTRQNACTAIARRKTAIARVKTLRTQVKDGTGVRRDRALRRVHALYRDCGLTFDDLAQALGCSVCMIWKHFARLKLPSHPSSHRRAGHVPARSIALARPRAFQTIDTPEKAYLLGILIADAKPIIRVRHVGKNTIVRDEGLKYMVGKRDRSVLKLLRTHLGSAAPITTTTSMLTHRNRTRRYEEPSLTVYSAQLARDLKKLGVVPRRTEKNIPLPKLRAHLIRHLVRGLIDGDGWITRDDRVRDPLKGWSCGVCGSEAVVSYVRRFAKRHGLAAPAFLKNGPHGLKVQWCGLEAIRMLALLYGANDPALPRKKAVARAIVKALHEAYPHGTQGSLRYERVRGRRRLQLTDAQRRDTPHARQLAWLAVILRRRHVHPTRGRRKKRQ